MEISELLRRLDEGYAALLAAIGRLDAAQMLMPAADGWTAKDQLAHITAWERGLAAFLIGQSRASAMGVSEDVFQVRDYDAINAQIWAVAQEKSLATVMAESQASHAQMRAILANMSSADLQRPYRVFAPNAPDFIAFKPIIGWIEGNTYDHYAEHVPLLLAAANVEGD